MIATHNHEGQKESLSSLVSSTVASQFIPLPTKKIARSAPLFLPHRHIIHNPKAGLNPIVDGASFLLSILGKIKQSTAQQPLSKLQTELIQEINLFQAKIKDQGYSAEYILVCRYILCATFDDMISETQWGCDKWEKYSLLTAFNQDRHHHAKFFNIIERILNEPVLYIDLMELIYICLCMGYKGEYRSIENGLFQLEQITHSLFKHIQTYRGHFSKNLSPTPLRAKTVMIPANPKIPWIGSIFMTGCIVMAIFISLGFIMDVISNEASKNLATVANAVSSKTIKQ